MKQAIREGQNPEVERVYLNRGYHKALREMGVNTKLESNRIPDVIAVTKDKNIRAYEVQSMSDRPLELKGRNLKVGDQLKPHGINVEVDVQQIPSWDYINKRPKE